MSSSVPPLLPDATRDLARFAAGLRFDDLPEAVVAKIKLALLDGIGVCLHGSTLPWTGHVRAMVEAEGSTPAASLFGTGRKTSVSQAVLVNSTAGHAFEMDDIHRDAIVHPNSLAVPIAFALSEAAGGLPGRDLLTAMVAGYEIGARVGSAATMALFLRGFHPQGTSGAFTAAATAGWLGRLDADRMQHAFGIAGSLGSGLMAAQEGAMVKRLHSGRAAQAGVYAAALAARGFTGISDVLEAGYGGFLSSLSGAPAPEKLTAGLGSTWETLNTGYKPYPSVTSIHSALDALAALMAEHGLGARDIERIEVGIGHMTFVHTAWTYRPAGVTAAQMNLFYGLAVMAIDGAASVDQYVESRLADPAILDFIARIHAYEDAGLEAMGPSRRHACRMAVTTRDGRRVEREILDRRGSPENPLSRADVEGKFRTVVRQVLPPAEIDRVLALVDGLDRAESAAPLTELVGARWIG